ncbi:MAG: ABC transporter permease subunit [Conexivisphaerales archaeon]
MQKPKTSFFEKNAPWLLVLPLVIYLASFTLFPIIDNIYISISTGTILSVFSLPFMDQTLLNTAIFSLGTVSLEFLFGLLLALLVDRARRGTKFFSSVFIVPLLVSPVAVAVIWLLILDPQYGPLNYFLSLLGIRGPFWVGQQSTIMLSAIIASAWEETPLTFLIIYAAFKSIPTQIYEAASVDGLGGFSLLKNITFPMAKPALAVAGLLALMTSFRSFDLVYMFAINGPFLYVQTLPYLLYQVSFVSNFQQYGSAISLLIMVIALIPTFLLLRMMKIEERLGLRREEKSESAFSKGLLQRLATFFKSRKGVVDGRRFAFLLPSDKKPRNEPPPRPKRMIKKKGLLSGILLYTALGVAAVISIFPFYWTIVTSLKTYDELFPAGGGVVLFPYQIDLSNWITALRELYGYLVTSLAVTFAVVLLTILISVPAAYSISRFKTGGTRLVSWNIIVNSMPSVIFIIPLFYYTQATHIYNTWWSLITTYLIFTVPIAVWLLVGFIEDVPKQIDEAARIDGMGTFSIIWRMVFPLLKPGIIAVVILSVINCWHEFLFTLILGLTVFNGQVPVGARGVTVFISNFISATGINWATISAGAVAISLPLIILAIILQKYFIGGLTLGSTKG